MDLLDVGIADVHSTLVDANTLTNLARRPDLGRKRKQLRADLNAKLKRLLLEKLKLNVMHDRGAVEAFAESRDGSIATVHTFAPAALARREESNTYEDVRNLHYGEAAPQLASGSESLRNRVS